MPARQPTGFFSRRWSGQVRPGTLFWFDIVLVASLLNLLASFAALMLIALGAPAGWAVAMHLAPLPYNLFMCVSLWRHPARSAVLAWAAALWFVISVLV